MINRFFFLRLLKGGIAFVLIAALAIATYIRAVQEPPASQSIEHIERREGKSVAVKKVEQKDFHDYLRVDSTIIAPRRHVLRANLNEIVEDVLVDVGDVVDEGDLLVRFRNVDLKSDVEAASARVTEAEKNYRRYRNLYERGLTSQDIVEARLTAMQDARAALQKASSLFEFAEVRAPERENFRYDEESIQVSERYVDPGEYMAAGQPLVTLTDMSGVEVRADVPESKLRHLSLGHRVQFRPAGEEKWSDAILKRVSPRTDDPHRFFHVYAAAENTRENGIWSFRFGMYAEARVLISERKSVYSVPAGSLRLAADGRNYVFLASGMQETPSGADIIAGKATAEEVEVKTGLRSEGWVEVVMPEFKGDELIVLNPRLDLNDGDKLKVTVRAGD